MSYFHLKQIYIIQLCISFFLSLKNQFSDVRSFWFIFYQKPFFMLMMFTLSTTRIWFGGHVMKFVSLFFDISLYNPSAHQDDDRYIEQVSFLEAFNCQPIICSWRIGKIATIDGQDIFWVKGVHYSGLIGNLLWMVPITPLPSQVIGFYGTSSTSSEQNRSYPQNTTLVLRWSLGVDLGWTRVSKEPQVISQMSDRQ